MDQHYEQWSELAPRGLLLIGAGATIIAHASSLRGRDKPFVLWVLLGVVGLITLNSGVAVFGEAVKHRTLYENKLGL